MHALRQELVQRFLFQQRESASQQEAIHVHFIQHAAAYLPFVHAEADGSHDAFFAQRAQRPQRAFAGGLENARLGIAVGPDVDVVAEQDVYAI